MVSASTETATRAGRKAGAKSARKPVREELRSGQVLGRDGEVLSRRRSTGFRNEFDVPPHLQDEGYSYQWVRTSCHGKEDPANVSQHYENGWRPAASSGLMKHYNVIGGKTIERDGLMLCERPQQLTNEALAEDRRNALELRNAQAEQFGARNLPDGFEDGRRSGDGRFDASKKVRRTVEGAPSSLLPERVLSVGDDD